MPENWTVWKSSNQGVKEETFIPIGRRVGDGQPSGEDSRQGTGGWGWARRQLADWAVPHLSADKPGGTTGEWDRPHNPGVQRGELKPQSLWLKTPLGDWGGSGRNCQPYRRVCWRDPQGPRTYTNPPTQESAPEGPNLIVDSMGSDWKPAESGASGTVPSRILPPHTAPQSSNVGCPGLVNT